MYKLTQTGSTNLSRMQKSLRQLTAIQVQDVETAELDHNRLGSAIRRAQRHLLSLQHPNGFWLGELEANCTLCADYLAFMHWSGNIDPDLQNKIVDHLLTRELAGGGWSVYQGGPVSLDPSVKAYLALRLAGMDRQTPTMMQAVAIIRDLGGLEKTRSYTRLFLALLGQIPWKSLPAIPVELLLAPTRFPINLYAVSAWTRAMLVPMAIIQHFRPTRKIGVERGVSELFGRQNKIKAVTADRWRVKILRWLQWMQGQRLIPCREVALSAAKQWMLDRLGEGCRGLGAIFPSMLQSLIALRCLGYDEKSPIYRRAQSAIQELFVDDQSGFRIQPCLSPVWDTALGTLSLVESGIDPDDSRIRNAMDWLEGQRIRIKGDWAVSAPKLKPSGWSFQFQNPFYPDLDDTAMVLLALRADNRLKDSDNGQAVNWLLQLQSRDGGWAAFDKDVQSRWLRRLPFADHKAILDPSCPDITGRVLELCGSFKMDASYSQIRRAIVFLKSRQQKDGSWYGRWGVNYIYGTAHALRGLRAVGVDMEEKWIQRGRRWLEAHQNHDGGWGETCASYADSGQKGKGPSTASQTAWALIGLCAFADCDRPSIHRGFSYLVGSQKPDGSWKEELPTGTGFPEVIYLRYDYYRLYWPLRALACYFYRD